MATSNWTTAIFAAAHAPQICHLSSRLATQVFLLAPHSDLDTLLGVSQSCRLLDWLNMSKGTARPAPERALAQCTLALLKGFPIRWPNLGQACPACLHAVSPVSYRRILAWSRIRD